MQPDRKLVAIDLFSGAGGLSLGLGEAGFHVAAALDNDPIAVSTYRKMIGPHILGGNIEAVEANELLSMAKIEPGECALLAGGPPCQGFSLQRRGKRNDPRNQLVLQFCRMIEEIQPKMFLMENVTGLLTKNGASVLQELDRRVGELGYHIHTALLDAADFGVPQRRKRAFLVGERTNGGSANFEFPSPTVETPVTVKDAIGELPSPPADGSPHREIKNHFREARLSALNIERIRHVPPGGGRDHLPEHLQLACHKNNEKHRHKDVYGRLAWDEPSVTLTARFDSFTRGRFGHPQEDRSLTIREGARLQTFPDWFSFDGNREEQARLVGNAVPPRMAFALGKAILETLGYPCLELAA